MGLLHGQVAIITGAGQGIGRAIALEYAREGAWVALLDRHAATAEDTRRAIEAVGGTGVVYALDVTDYERYASVIAEIVAQRDKIDILVNNAAISIPGTILGDTLENWRLQMGVNLEAVYMGSKLVAPHMAARHYGRIIHIASIQGFASSGDIGAYNAAKGGVLAYTKSMAVELGPYNILVNAVAPGFIRTPMSIKDDIDETTTPDYIAWYIERGKIPLRRTGLPEDVAGTVVFLASDYCRYMTGQVLVVDGGMTVTF